MARPSAWAVVRLRAKSNQRPDPTSSRTLPRTGGDAEVHRARAGWTAPLTRPTTRTFLTRPAPSQITAALKRGSTAPTMAWSPEWTWTCSTVTFCWPLPRWPPGLAHPERWPNKSRPRWSARPHWSERMRRRSFAISDRAAFLPVSPSSDASPPRLGLWPPYRH
jgi:hypothetical protein